MPWFRRRACLLGAVLLLTIAGPAPAASPAVPDLYPAAAASHLMVMDGQVVSAHQPDAALPAGSLVKLLTALVLLERDFDGERWIPVTARAAGVEPSKIGLRTGESLRAGAALGAMLIRSANDACLTLVDNSGLSPGGFIEQMNRTAQGLGLAHSHFADPCGFDSRGQFSTAQDLLELAQAAESHPLIAQIVASPSASVVTRGGRRIDFESTNKLLGRLPGTLGTKAGHTRLARECLIARVQRGSHDLWLVMLGSDERWLLAHGMIERAYSDLDVPAP
jgi:D-alanyl-D-alanine carboxypeptidase